MSWRGNEVFFMAEEGVEAAGGVAGDYARTGEACAALQQWTRCRKAGTLPRPSSTRLP